MSKFVGSLILFRNSFDHVDVMSIIWENFICDQLLLSFSWYDLCSVPVPKTSYVKKISIFKLILSHIMLLFLLLRSWCGTSWNKVSGFKNTSLKHNPCITMVTTWTRGDAPLQSHAIRSYATWSPDHLTYPAFNSLSHRHGGETCLSCRELHSHSIPLTTTT